MPRLPRHTLVWSQDRGLYELSTSGQFEQDFRPEESDAWQRWLAGTTAFTFSGTAGRLKLYRENRPGDRSYWYAYHFTAGCMTKRYLGHPSRVTFSRLEDVAQSLSRPSPPARFHPDRPAASHHVPPWEEEVLLSKLAPPLFSSSLVIRQRLLSQLDQARSHRLTVLAASAGWGKTTVLAMWAARAGFPVAWLSLDASDNDPIRFWLAMLAALRRCVPGVGQRALNLLRSPQAPPLLTILQTLLNDLTLLTEPLIVLVDDYHLISEPAIHDTLLFVLEHLPHHLHLVLASRIDPPLPLSRWRVRGSMLELRDADLRFEPQEAGQFFTETMGLSLSGEDVAALTRRTEGWIAGLQLAALSLRHHDDWSACVRHFSGTHRFVLDYVQQEILERLPQEQRMFLLQAAILTRLSASLCQAVTEEGGSQALLEQLERSNLFVVPLDEERRWYRLHELFREALLARLHATAPHLVPQLHQRAARWYEGQGLLREAIPHALAAQDSVLAACVMEQAAATLWMHGEASTMMAWVAALPERTLLAHARLALNAALHLLESLRMVAQAAYEQGQELVEGMLGRLETALHSQEVQMSASEQAVIQRRLWVLRAWMEMRGIIRRGDQGRLRRLSQEAEALPLDEEEMWNLIPLSFRSLLTVTYQMEGTLLVPQLQAARQRAQQAGDDLTAVHMLRLLANASLEQAAQWHRVQQECQEGLRLIQRGGWKTSSEGNLYLYLYNVYYAWNQLDEAEQALQQALRIGHEWQHLDLLIVGWASFAQLSLARGDLACASQALQQMEALINQDGFASHAPWVVVTRIRLWLAQGKRAEAAAWAAQIARSADVWEPWNLWNALMLARIALAHQQYASALAILSRFQERMGRLGNAVVTIECLALMAVALYFAQRWEEAEETALRLLCLTEPEHSQRVYLDAGDPMHQVLTAWLRRARQQPESRLAMFRPYLSRLLEAFADQEQRRPVSARPEPARAPDLLPAPAVVPPLLDPLTSSEQRILRLLAAGHSNREIAHILIISPNTVKTHLKNLYGKLQVSSRTQACALARDLGLL